MTHELRPARKHKWKRRIFIGLAIGLVLLILVQNVRTHIARNRLVSQWESFHQRGESVSIFELKQPGIPDELNAVPDLIAATQSVTDAGELIHVLDEFDFW